MTYNVLIGTLNPTHSLTQSLSIVINIFIILTAASVMLAMRGQLGGLFVAESVTALDPENFPLITSLWIGYL